MKQRLLFLLTLCLAGFHVSAQTTYQSSDYADIGDDFLFSTANIGVQLFDFDSTGAGISWDFSNLPLSTQSSVNYIDPNSAGYKTAYLAQCVLNGNWPWDCNTFWNNATNLAVEGQDSLSFGGVQFTNSVTHQHKSSQTLRETILGLSFGTGQLALPLVIEYDNVDTIYQFPLQYPNVDSSYKAYTIDLSPANLDFVYLARQQRINEVEGWGSLVTPYDTFASVLKMRTELINNDSLIFNGDTLSAGTTRSVLYRWFDPAFGQPVLEAEGQILAGLELITEVRYLDTLQCLEPNPFYLTSPLIPILDPSTGEVEINFNNTSTNADSYQWDFGDGNTSTQANPTHTYQGGGVYQVRLIACNSICNPVWCDTLNLPLIVIDTTSALNAAFFVTPLINRCSGEDVNFNNISSNASTYQWDFGDGNTSNLEDPSHVYANGGSYTVTLIADDGTSADTTTQAVSITQTPTPDLGADTTITNNASLFLDAGNGNNYLWSDGSDQPTLTVDGTQLPKGTYTYWVEVSANGCEGTDSINVAVTWSASLNPLSPIPYTLYPNPGRDFLTLEFAQNGEFEILVYDVQGSRVIREESRGGELRLNTSPLAQGIYLIAVKRGEEVWRTKWVKQ